MATVENANGSRHEGVKALFNGKSIIIPDEKIPISPGDAILRQLPSGLVERFIVTDPGFITGQLGIKSHYQVKYRREGTQPEGVPGYVIHVSGPNARVNLNSIDNSQNSVSYIQNNLTEVADELIRLRAALLERATDPEHYVAVGSIAQAEIAAKAGDGGKVQSAMSGLGTAGKWAFGVAKDIGVNVAAEIIKKSVGL